MRRSPSPAMTARRAAGLEVQQVCVRLRMTPRWFQHLERHGGWTLAQIETLARLYGCPSYVFLTSSSGGEGHAKPGRVAARPGQGVK